MEIEPDVMKVAYGEILQSVEDTEFKSTEGNTMILKQGDKSIVGFDDMLHCLKERYLIHLDEDMKIEGYSATGLSKFLTVWLDKVFDLDEALRKTEITKDDISKCLEEALCEIGMQISEEEGE